MRQLLFYLLSFSMTTAVAQSKKPPIIDMHLHAYPADYEGFTPVGMCSPFAHWHVRDAKQTGQQYYVDVLTKNLFCNGKSYWSPSTNDSIRQETLRLMSIYNVYGVTSGPYALVQQWKKAAPERVIPGIEFSPTMNISVDTLRRWFTSGSIQVLGEVVAQYDGITLSDSIMEPYLKLAEELDVPMSVHVGPGPPGIAYAGASRYRARYHSALVLEEALLRHPSLRVIVAHAGWPMIDDMLAVLYAHPQVYVDLGIICYGFPKKEFYGYLQRLVDAGFGKRVCFGSDQMIWPQTMVAGIETIQKASFLTEEQKRDILYNNAARFLRLSPTQITAHNR